MHHSARTPLATTIAIVLVGVLGACLAQPDGNAVGDGAVLYDSYCALCHGADLGGTGRAPSLLAQIYSADQHTDADFRTAITKGVAQHHWTFGPMAPITALDAVQVDAVIAYLRAMQQSQGLRPG